MTVRDVESLLDGWTGMRVMRYIDESDTYETVFDNHSMLSSLPDDVANYEITEITVDHGDIVLKCDYWEEV